jgi:hypothetical protein
VSLNMLKINYDFLKLVTLSFFDTNILLDLNMIS